MKLLIVYGIFLALLVQASFQYPHYHHHEKHHQKLVSFPDTNVDEEVFKNPRDTNENAANANLQNLDDTAKNVILLDSEDFMDLLIAKNIDTLIFEGNLPQKRNRRNVTFEPLYNKKAPSHGDIKVKFQDNENAPVVSGVIGHDFKTHATNYGAGVEYKVPDTPVTLKLGYMYNNGYNSHNIGGKVELKDPARENSPKVHISYHQTHIDEAPRLDTIGAGISFPFP